MFIMSEEEARTKYCPMMRIQTSVGIRINTDGTPNWDHSACIASGCMMWREVKDGGYCGLAGNPVIQE